MSEHKNLHEALCAFQAEVETLPKDARNPHFNSRFTPLDTIVERVGPLLAKHGLTWSTFPCFGPSNEPALRYKLTHAASGDCEADMMPLMVTKADPQGLGSSLTYARRYSLSAVLNLVSDDDDDGNAASLPAQSRAASSNGSRQPESRPANGSGERIASAKQRGLMNARASEAELCPTDYAAALLKAAGQEARDFESEDHAQQFVNRQLDRLPARLVDKVLEEIAAMWTSA